MLPFTYIMEQRRQIQEMRGRQPLKKIGFRLSQPAQFRHGLQLVPVNRINMIEVMLGKGFHPAKLRNVGWKQTGLQHGFQGWHRVFRRLKQFQKISGDSFRGTKFFINEMKVAGHQLA